VSPIRAPERLTAISSPGLPACAVTSADWSICSRLCRMRPCGESYFRHWAWKTARPRGPWRLYLNAIKQNVVMVQYNMLEATRRSGVTDWLTAEARSTSGARTSKAKPRHDWASPGADSKLCWALTARYAGLQSRLVCLARRVHRWWRFPHHPRAMPQRARQGMRCDVPAAMGGSALKFQAVITAAWAIGCRSAARLGLPVNAAWRPIYVPPHPCDPGVRPGGRTCERRLSDPIGAADTAQKQPGVTAAGSSRRCLGTLHLSVSWHDLQWF
jgi:hypothetical protein